MGGIVKNLLGGGPKIKAPAPVEVPTKEDAEGAAAKEMERRKRQRGRAATLLTQGDDTSSGGVATKKLLGG